MHQKKRKLFVLYSIPIWFRKKFSKLNLCKEKLHLVSYSIPLSCMVVLLLGLIMMANPDRFVGQKSYAVDNAARANVNPVLGLAVTNSDKVIETVQGGNTAYSDHLVMVTGTEVTNYTLSMSSSSSSLTKPSGTSGANITGAEGATGSSMPANRWGYAITEENASDSSYGGLTYNTVPTAATKIAEGNAGSDHTLNVKKKIVIAAKFGEDAAPGTYRQTINLSTVANPTTVTFKITYNSNGGGTAPVADTQNSMENSVNFTLAGQGSMSKSGYKFVGWSTDQNATSGTAAGSIYTVNRTQPQVALYAVWQALSFNTNITTMQQMTPAICQNADIRATKTLKDSRDNNNYDIVKLEDGRCWMQQNLRLTGSRTLTSSDSNVSSNWSMPASLTSLSSTNFSSSNYYKAESYYQSGTLNTTGVYYSFTAATAGAATSSVTSGEVGGTKGNSVCPKGWMLPTDSEYSNMLSKAGIGNDSAGSTKIRRSPYSFSCAGGVDSGSHFGASSFGYYWSRTVNGSNYAYFLYLTRSEVYTVGIFDRYYGYSVRCVAEP